MLQWKTIQGRWHLTYEDIPVCRLSTQMAEQTQTQICPGCVDSLSVGIAQWQQIKKQSSPNQK